MVIALVPQAGVAVGMVLVASSHFPEYREILLTTVISSTIFFEIVGPVLSRFAISQAEKNIVGGATNKSLKSGAKGKSAY
jgi:hypothetical protein